MPSKSKLIHWLSIPVLLISAAQLACALTSQDVATPTPETIAQETEVAQPTTELAPSATHTPPAPTATPLPPLPPQLVGRSPARGEEWQVDAPLVIRFDQPMNQISVEDAFGIQPTMRGGIEWADDRTMLFRPIAHFERQTRYSVIIRETAASAAGLMAELPFSFHFQTVGFLEVSQTLPADATEAVDVDTTITIMFNRPVVPLVHTSSQKDLPHPLRFDPPIGGEGEWINTSIYSFRPDGPMAAGTTYRVIVAAGLEDTTGGLLVDDYAWTFTTQAPQIVWSQPSSEDLDIGLTQNISITFNQPMDHSSTQAALRIQAADGTVPPGRLRWNEDSTTMGWWPEGLLEMDTRYDWELSTQAQSTAGGAPLQEGMSTSFWTAQYPALLFTSPNDGDSSADPYGALDLYFASPMDTSTLMPNLSIIPEPTSVYTWWDRWENRFYVNFDLQASTAYTITAGPEMADPYGNRVGEETIVHFTTDKLGPMVYLNTPGRLGTYNAYTQTVVFATYRNVDQLDLTLTRLDVGDLIRLTGPGSWQEWDDYVPSDQDTIRNWTIPVDDVLNETIIWRVPLSDGDGNPLSHGIYYLQTSAPGLSSYQISKHVLVISPINLTVKAAADQALVWATDLVSGQPVADLPIIVVDGDNEPVASGTTDADGLLMTQTSTRESSTLALYAVAAEPGHDSFSIASSRWSDGIDVWDFGLRREDYGDQDTKTYLYTDRPIYRPGNTVYFKGILREPEQARYRLPQSKQVLMEAYDWEDTLIYQKTLSVTELGTFAGEFTLDEEAKTGHYHFVIDPDGLRDWVYFQVAEYRKPEFQVEMSPGADQIVAGDTLQVGVQASYFFGGAVDGAAVEWAVFSDDYAFRWEGTGRYVFADFRDWHQYWRGDDFWYGYGELIAEGSGVTGAGGEFTISLPAGLGDEAGAQLLTIEATVEDTNHQRVTGRDQIVVHPAAQYVGIYADRFVGTAGEDQTVNLIVVDLEQEPLPGAEATFVALQREWFNVQVEEDGRTRWEWILVETPVYTETVSMGENGRSSLTFAPPSGGSYRLHAITSDDAGRENRASAFLWVSSSRYVSWQMENNDRIELIADKESYRPGDVAEILIPSPFRGEVKALVTIERGRFLGHEIITLNSNSEIYRLPITADHAPTIFVSVVLVKGIDETNKLSSFKMGTVQLNVSNEQQALTVELTPNADTFLPGDTVTYDVRVTDYGGNPIAAELSLALVDLSVLTLAPDQAEPILDAFYSERGLGVDTGVGLVLNVNRLNEQIADKAKGGGGGGGEAAFGIGIELRSEFPETAYWEAFLTTDDDGHGRVEIPLPDNLTTWRLSAKAITADTLVGQASVDIVATKPLLIRPITPRFFVVGDQAQLGAIVHNNTDAALQVNVTLATQGITLSANTPAAKTVDIAAGGRAQVNWDVTVQEVDNVYLIFAATGGGLTDATKPTLVTGPEGTIPVFHYSAPDVVGTAGQLTGAGSRTEGILLPPNIDTTQGTLKVELAPSLAAAMQDGLDYLEHFQYECTEQTVSRFLPNVLTYRALEELDLVDPELESELEELVGQGLQRLYNQQHYDGGWGWWYTGESSAQVSAWVLLGLDKAVEAGFRVDRQVLDDAEDYLRDRVLAPRKLESSWQANLQAFVLYVLAERGETTVSRLETLLERKDKLSHFGKAYLALAYGLLEGTESERIDTLVADISGEAILSATGAHWEETENDWRSWNTDTRTTSIILDLLARFDPENDLAPNVVRWLMTARTAGHWETTQETAWALIGLTDWMAATGELEADYRFDAAFNGRSMVEASAGRATIRETTELQISVADMLLEQVNHLTIGRSDGPGRLYYTAHLETFLPVEEVEPIGRGVMIAREYTAAVCNPDEETCSRLAEIAVGEAVRVKLTIVAPHDLYYVLVEDPLPAGAEAVDQNLLTSSSLDAGEGWEQTDAEYRWGYWGWWWFSHTQVRDEKVVLFADFLPAGTYEYTYIMRASLPGEYHVIPATVREFYFPEVYGRSDGMLFVIEP